MCLHSTSGNHSVNHSTTHTNLNARPRETTTSLTSGANKAAAEHATHIGLIRLCMRLLSIALQETSINPASDHAHRIDFSRSRDSFAQICRETPWTPHFLLLSHTCICACIWAARKRRVSFSTASGAPHLFRFQQASRQASKLLRSLCNLRTLET
jgi:hypothetical protein